MTPDELRRAISDFGMTQVAFAERVGVAPQTVRRWLSGKRRIPGPLAELIRLLEKERSRNERD
jgi:DNA-binding transcriptional regulator YiaG